jgi:nitrate reductase gamma subunit
LLAGGIASAAGMEVSAGGSLPGVLLHYVTLALGYAGLCLAFIGSLGLLLLRLTNPDYADYTKKADYFNLAFFVVTLGVALAAHFAADPGFEALRQYAAGLVTFDLSFSMEGFTWKTGLLAAEIVLGSLLFAYIPMTHMSHFFAKLFLYHDIRWNDEPNLKGGKLEKEINEALQHPVSWSAKHIRGDGRRTWVDVATSPVEESENGKQES